VEAPAPRTLLALVLVLNVLGTAVVGLFGAFVVTGNELLKRAMFAVLAVMLTALAGHRFLVVAARSRRPRLQRAHALVLLVAAGFLVVLAFSGV
jgi:uncharacterized membrane protein YdcZ (DUF606 family)